MRARSLIAETVMIALAATGYAGEPYFTGLGDLPDGRFQSEATVLSADGSSAAGWSAYGSESWENEPFRWRKDSGMMGLGLPSGGTWARSLGISSDGDEITGYGDAGWFHWTESSGMGPVSDPPGAGNYREVRFADDLSAAVWYSNDTVYVWRESDGNELIGRPPGAWDFVWGTGISGDGQTVLVAAYRGDFYHAFHWTEGGGWVEIPAVDFQNYPRAASPDGRYIVGWDWIRAFRHDVVTHATVLIDRGDGNEEAVDVSADGRAVLILHTPYDGSPTDTYLWTDPERGGNGLRALQSILEDDYGLDLAGWRLEQPVAISDDGRTITGTGRNPAGRTEAWVAHLGRGRPHLGARGDCPGPMEVEVNGASPNARVAFAWAFGEGSTQIPIGKPCAGTTLGLDATVKRALVERADASGTVSFLSRVSPRFCGRVYLQALDLASCSTTNVVLIE